MVLIVVVEGVRDEARGGDGGGLEVEEDWPILALDC